jgi:hypothetical protein
MTEFNPCPVCRKSDFVSRTARDNHVYRCRKKKYSSAEFPQVEKAFEGLEPQARETEKPKSAEVKARQTTKRVSSADILSIYETENEKVRLDFLQGKIRYISDAKEELETRLTACGIDAKTAKEFCRIFEKRLITEKASLSQPKQNTIAPQSQPHREPTLDEMAEMEAQKVNAQRGFAIVPRYACEVCHRDGLSYEEAVVCENSHREVTTIQNETETPRGEKPKINPRQIQPQALPQSDVLFRLGKSLFDRLKSPKSKPEEKTEEEQQVQEENYSPVTYLNTIRWSPPEPIESQECKICGRIDYISNFRAGLHGRGVCS